MCDWYAPRVGGIESYLRDLAVKLRAAGHRPEVITATPGADDRQDDGVVVHRLPTPRLPGWDVIFTPSALARLRRLIDGFDLVHGHSLYSPLAHASMFVARQRGIPSVLTSHSLLSPAGVLGFSAWKAWARWPTVLTAVSSLAAAETRVASGRERVHVIANGIDPAPAPAEPCHRRARPVVVSVMRLHRRKQPLDFVRVIPRVDAQLRPDERPDFVLVGDGPERARVERLAVKLGVQHRLQRTGALPRAQVRALLQRADLFVLPTVREAFGIAILEARAAGLPVVALRGTGAADLVEHGRNGLLAESASELADPIATLCRDGTLCARLAASARAGLERFSWATVLERHLDVYALARGATFEQPRAEAA